MAFKWTTRYLKWWADVEARKRRLGNLNNDPSPKDPNSDNPSDVGSDSYHDEPNQ